MRMIGGGLAAFAGGTAPEETAASAAVALAEVAP